MIDPTKSAATQPYRTTPQAQQAARRPDLWIADHRCPLCQTPHADQAEADACCLDEKAAALGRRLGGI